MSEKKPRHFLLNTSSDSFWGSKRPPVRALQHIQSGSHVYSGKKQSAAIRWIQTLENNSGVFSLSYKSLSFKIQHTLKATSWFHMLGSPNWAYELRRLRDQWDNETSLFASSSVGHAWMWSDFKLWNCELWERKMIERNAEKVCKLFFFFLKKSAPCVCVSRSQPETRGGVTVSHANWPWDLIQQGWHVPGGILGDICGRASWELVMHHAYSWGPWHEAKSCMRLEGWQWVLQSVRFLNETS